MLQRRVLWLFVLLILVVIAIGLFSLEVATSTSRDYGYLVDHTASTLHALSHLKAATAGLLLEAERLRLDEDGEQLRAFIRAQESFEDALAEYELVAAQDDSRRELLRQIAAEGGALLSQADTLRQLPASGAGAEQAASLAALRQSEQQLTASLEEAIQLEAGELRQGDLSAQRAARGRRQLAILLTGGGLILAVAFGALLLRRARLEKAMQEELQQAKVELEAEVKTGTRSLEAANRALKQELEQRKQTEIALAQSEDRFRVAAEEALVGIYIIQEDRLRYVNPMMAHFFGYEPRDLIDTVSPLALIAPEDRADVAARIRQRFSGRPADTPFCFRGLHRAGSELLLESIGRRIQFQEQPAIIGTMLEVTERERSAAEIAQRNRELQALLTVSQRLAGAFALEERLQTIAEAIVETIAGARAASLWLYDGQGQLAVRAWKGYDEEEIASLRAPTAEALARLVSEVGQPRLVTTRRAGKRRAGGDEDETHSVLGVPIVLEGQLLGALFADSFSPLHAFNQHDLRLLQAVAGEAAIAIKNAQLLEATERHQEELRQLSQQLLTAREAEARRISRELHDVVGQALTAISINLAEVKRTLSPEMSAQVQERLQESEMLMNQTLNQVKELSLELRPSMLDDLGLLPTLRWYLHRFGQRLGIETSLEAQGFHGRLPPEVETTIYRVVQEGLTNVARHAQASSVEVRLCRQNRQLELIIADDGVGFDRTKPFPPDVGKHLGLVGMRERVASAGGFVQVDSTPGQGTRLLVHLPCRNQPAPAGTIQV